MSTVTKSTTDAQFTNAVSGDGTGAITYTSGTPGVATVDVNGQVTIVGTGSTVITASKAATATHAATTATYTVNVGAVAKTSPDFTLIAANNTVTITLTGGTFKADPIGAGDFTFAGTDAVALAAGTFTRVNDTTVTITNITGLSGTDNAVTVKDATFATQAATSSVAAVASN